MHLNNDDCIERAKELGFSVAEVKSKKLIKAKR